jgi:hypothetical protein
LSYYGDPPSISNGAGFLKIWTINGGTAPVLLVLLQWTPVP